MDTAEDQPITNKFVSFSRYSSLAVTVIGIFALTGWIFDIQVFKSVLPGLPTMKANTALAFILAGIVLWFANRGKLELVPFRIVQICSSLVFVIGLFTLMQYSFRWDLGIDQLVFKDLQTQPDSFPGRMAFASALCFSLIGAASIFIRMGNGKVLAIVQYLAVIVLAISFPALVGYVYDVEALYKFGAYSSMALHTTVGFILLALGTLTSRPDRGWMRLISTETAGGSVLRRILPFILGIPIFIGWLVILGNRAGWYETHFGIAMLAVMTASLLIITLWLVSRYVDLIDTNRKRAEEQIVYQANLLENVNDAIVASDANFRLTAWNAAAEAMYGWRADEVLGRTGTEILQTEFPGLGADTMWQKISETGKWRGEATQLRKDGTRIPVDISSIVLHNSDGQVNGYLSVNRDITERKEAESALKRVHEDLEQRVAERTTELSSSEARFRGLFEHAPVSIWEEDFSAVRQYVDDLRRAGITDFSSYFDTYPEEIAKCTSLVKIVDVNHATLEMYQAESKNELLTNLSRVMGPESLPMFKHELLALIRGEVSYENETVNYTLHGERLIIFLNLTIAPGHVGSWSKLFVSISDITKRREAEAALVAEHDLLQELMDNIPDTIYFKDTASRFTRINRAQASVLGVATAEDAIGKTDLDFQTSELAQIFYEEEQQIVQSGESLTNRVEFNPTPDGQPRWFSATKVPIKDGHGNVIGIVGISRDITERKQIEDALREAEIKYRMLVEHLPAIVYLDQYDPTISSGYRPVYMSPQVSTILGYHSEEFIKDPNLWSSLHHPDDHERALIAEAQHYESGTALRQEYRLIARNGGVVWLRDEAVMIRDEATGKVFSQGVLLDITDRKVAEEALRQSEERFRLISWATKDAVWDWNLSSNQIEWGTGLQKIFHYSSETAQTNREWWLEHVHPDDRDKVKRSMKQALERGLEFWSKEYRFQRVDETYANIMDRGYIIRDYTGKPYRIIGAMMDITEQKQAEKALREANEKMARSLSELEMRNQEIVLLNEMGDLLHASLSEREAHAIIVDAAKKLFPNTLGALYLFNTDRTLVTVAASWGDPPPVAQLFAPNDCWALRRGQTHQLYNDESKPPCAHISEPMPAVTYCLPMVAQGEVLGILHLQSPSKEIMTEPKHQLAYTVVEQASMALSNLKLREALREQSIRDPLTGLYNRRYMEEVLKQHLRRVTRHLHPLGVIMIDIDHFKSFNDTHGHAAGDALLRELGRFLQSHIRGEDVACRYGGEEFILIMPHASLETARQRAEDLRDQAKGVHVHDAGQSLGGVTLSLGVAVYPQHGRTMENVLRAADAALYRAKQEGRDRVAVTETAN